MQTTKHVSSVGVWEVKRVDVSKPTATKSTKASHRLGRRMRRFSRVTSRMRLRDWLLLIPNYNGSPDGSLAHFIDSVRYVGSHFDEERVLLLALGAKLKCKARTLFQHKLYRYESIEKFLNGLNGIFGGLGTEAWLLNKLRTTRQRQNESLEDYGARLDSLATRLVSIYQEDPISRPEMTQANKKLIRDMAITRFRRGLRRSELEVQLAGYEVESLDEAISIAVTHDNELQTRISFSEQYLLSK